MFLAPSYSAPRRPSWLPATGVSHSVGPLLAVWLSHGILHDEVSGFLLALLRDVQGRVELVIRAFLELVNRLREGGRLGRGWLQEHSEVGCLDGGMVGPVFHIDAAVRAAEQDIGHLEVALIGGHDGRGLGLAVGALAEGLGLGGGRVNMEN